jgi:hypothetical protein
VPEQASGPAADDAELASGQLAEVRR